MDGMGWDGMDGMDGWDGWDGRLSSSASLLRAPDGANKLKVAADPKYFASPARPVSAFSPSCIFYSTVPSPNMSRLDQGFPALPLSLSFSKPDLQWKQGPPS